MQNLNYGRPSPAMSNTERQRRFRERNPGYYGRLHRARNAEIKAMVAAMAAAPALPAPVPVREPLMLPAPVQCTLLDELNALIQQRERELVPVQREAA